MSRNVEKADVGDRPGAGVEGAQLDLGEGRVVSEVGMVVVDDAADRLPAWIRWVGRALSVAAGVALVVLMVLTVVDVLRRQAAERGVPYSIETTELVLVGVVFASLMSAEIGKTHVRTSILTNRLPVRAARLVRLIGMIVSTGFAAWLAYATWTTGWASFEIQEYRAGIGRFPIWPAKLMIPIGFLALTLVCGGRCVLLARGLVGAAVSAAAEQEHR